MNKQAIMLKQEIVAAFIECEDSGDYLESGSKKFERKLDQILTGKAEVMKQAILDEIAEVSFKDEETGDELVYVGDVEFILTAHEGEITETLQHPCPKCGQERLMKLQSDRQVAKRMIEEFEKEAISKEYTFNPYQLALLAWIKRWLEKEGE